MYDLGVSLCSGACVELSALCCYPQTCIIKYNVMYAIHIKWNINKIITNKSENISDEFSCGK